MSELRLVPVALLVWGIVLSVVLTRSPWVASGLLAVALAVTGFFRAYGHSIVCGALGAVACGVSTWRVHVADSFQFRGRLVGDIASAASQTATGSWFVQLEIPGFPGTVPALVKQKPPPMGTSVLVQAEALPAERASLSPVILQVSRLPELGPAGGLDSWANAIKSEFVSVVESTVGPSSQGLLPGMVLGDTSAQSAQEKQLYIDTGLSHLSAVSGSNVAIVTTAAVLLARAMSLGPRVQVALAAIALAVFVLLVGTEPSVLRASVTGIVGMLAVLGSAQAEPMHGLALAVTALLLWDTSLAVSFGFALSVAATAGIVALFPLLYRAIANRILPDILNRALAVAIAADVVTMPLVATMSGKIATVSVLANVLVAPAVAPVTILGLVAVLLNLLPGGMERIPLKIAEPCSWWIHTVATRLGGWEHSTLTMSVVGSMLVASWIVWLIHTKRFWVFLLLPLAALPAFTPVRTSELQPDPDRVIHLRTIPDDYRAPPHTQVIVVWEEGRASKRGHITAEGIPVWYPRRDPGMRLLIDGTQRLN